MTKINFTYRQSPFYLSETEIVKGDARMFFRPLRTGNEVMIEERIGSLRTREYRTDLADGRKRYAAAIAEGYK